MVTEDPSHHHEQLLIERALALDMVEDTLNEVGRKEGPTRQEKRRNHPNVLEYTYIFLSTLQINGKKESRNSS